MNTTSHSPKCPRCGAAVAPGAPEGLCPRCLLEASLGTETKFTGEPAASRGPRESRSIAEIAALFPQLEILRVIGQGGMGTVYLARQPSLDRLVALKILAAPRTDDRGFAERFAREARALAKLSHPNIVTVHDFGEVAGNFYLLMEFVDGLNLRELIAARKIAASEALAIVPRICDALQFAHEQGIVHRDIKPENILLDKQGRVKIADFGIAKLLGQTSADRPLTGAQDRFGTPHYMAPEQVEKPLTVDHRADIYSLGVVFYELLTGELPLGRFGPPSSRVQVDVRLDEVVLHALEKEPSRRYQQASEVRTAVETIASTAAPKKTDERKESPAGRRGPTLVTFALLVLLSVVFTVVWTRKLGAPISPGPASNAQPSPARAAEVLPATVSDDHRNDGQSANAKSVVPSPGDEGHTAAAVRPEPVREISGAGIVDLQGKLKPFVLFGQPVTYFDAILGRRVFDGVPFVIDGVVELSSQTMRDKYPGADTPEAIENVPVGQTFAALHLLHYCKFEQGEVEGNVIAHVRFNYMDGSAHEFPIVFGGHVRDVIRYSPNPEMMSDPRTRVVWRGTGPGPAPQRSAPSDVRLFESVLRNPYPEKMVRDLDFISHDTTASYCLVAATAVPVDSDWPARAQTETSAPGR
jgi:serine/threonine protein kinase